MFKVGDKIVYPMHGAGEIIGIDEKCILGEKKSYYTMHLFSGNIQLMIPVNCEEDLGLRSVADFSVLPEIISIFKEYTMPPCHNWNKRYRENMLKIRTGNIIEVSKVVKSLMGRDIQRGLSTGERKMLSSARQILISELCIILSKPSDEIENIIGDAFMQSAAVPEVKNN